MLLTVVPLVALLLWSGYWRVLMTVFAIRPRRLTVKRLGLFVDSPQDVDRVDTVLSSFAGGFNAMIARPSDEAARAYCASLPALYRPFAEEGRAMGYIPRRLFRFDAGNFERRIVARQPEFRYLYYVGLGFWAGLRNHRVNRLQAMVEGLDPLHGHLCFDGYGFQRAFFHYRSDTKALQRLDSLVGYQRNAAFHGVGRALWFLYMSRPSELITQLSSLGAVAADVAAGVGLAAVFVNPDRIEVAQTLAREMPGEWQKSFHLGMCFALKARSINDNAEFQGHLSRMDEPVQAAVLACIRECDRVELVVRAQSCAEPYRLWRERVANWMSDHIEYPLAGMKERRTGESAPSSGKASGKASGKVSGKVPGNAGLAVCEPAPAPDRGVSAGKYAGGA